MELQQIKEKLHQEEYDFLRNNPNLDSNIMLLGLGGSHARGTATKDSDIDIRGIAFNSKSDILLGTDFNQVTDKKTDTTIYSFNKMLDLLTNSNPNVIELLGLKPEHYLYCTDIGKMLIDNRKMFLSKVCIYTFEGQAHGQLRRMENKAARVADQKKQEENILKSIQDAKYSFKDRYFTHPDDAIELYIDESQQKDYDTEIFMNIHLSHYPLRDWAGMWNEMKSIINSYSKIGKRNKNAIEHDKLGKHMMCFVDLYIKCIDILEKEDIITYREAEHDLLMSIRNGEYLDSNKQPIPEFYELVDEYEKRLNYAKENTSLPDVPDRKRIEEFKMYVNERIVRGDV